MNPPPPEAEEAEKRVDLETKVAWGRMGLGLGQKVGQQHGEDLAFLG